MNEVLLECLDSFFKLISCITSINLLCVLFKWYYIKSSNRSVMTVMNKWTG